MGYDKGEVCCSPFLFFMTEAWKWVPGYDGKYLVSDWGRVKSVYGESKYGKRRPTNTIRKLNNDRKGYLIIELLKFSNGVSKTAVHRVHRLVALAFIPNPHNKPHINHLDVDKANNRVSNLQWCTPKENVNHALDTGLWRNRGRKQPYKKKGFRKVIDVQTGVVYEDAKTLAGIINWNPKYLRRRLSGELKNITCFMYLKDYEARQPA